MRDLKDIYDKTTEVEEVYLFCLYTNHEPIYFEEAVKNEE